ncbi:hypothetical protein [Streptomyces sp. ML-6]|uniref:hypothetical protein n=1 Tax=Streptomyces sp. ML-6 TaxID=2982693 RepID=UPI0024C0E079|nr:hypothetical protein [Streptomyces sp. ML-6]MDK0524997.1 hypothetical protein [Streptomyces sp. ML-6]
MRRPTQHHRAPAAHMAWAHPYTGVDSLAVFYNDGGDPPVGSVPNPADPPKPAPPAQRTFTQAEVEALAAKEKAQGQRAGARTALEEFAAEHGFNNVDDAKAFIAAARKAQQDALSEDEKRRQELEQRERELAAREAAATARERDANRRAVLVGLGATGDDLEDAAALLRVDDSADESTVRDAAEKLKERRPELFGTKPAPQPSALPPAPGGAPAGSPPRTPAGKDDVQARARKRAEQMGFRRPDAA